MIKNCALITGGAKRIGREIALELASKGYDIAISYNSSKKEALNLAQEIIATKKVKCEIFQADLTDKEAAKKLIEDVLNKFPDLNLLINSASIFNKSNIFDIEQLDENFALHFHCPLILSQEFAKNVASRALKNAQIINFLDKNITRFDTKYFYYLLSKKLFAELTKMMALQLAPEVRCNGIAPGFILEDKFLQKDEEMAQKIIKKIPLNKKGNVGNILKAINYLIANEFVCGEILFVDGAASLNHAG
jgi:NAD(P)-dependent dehydrogenase (short-subunit alcohol dehydrogenase family)